MIPTLSIKPHQETMKGSKLDVTPPPPFPSDRLIPRKFLLRLF